MQELSEETRRLCASRLMTILEAAGKAKRSDHTEAKGSDAKQHERRGENELLKQAVMHLTTEQNTKVSFKFPARQAWSYVKKPA